MTHLHEMSGIGKSGQAGRTLGVVRGWRWTGEREMQNDCQLDVAVGARNRFCKWSGDGCTENHSLPFKMNLLLYELYLKEKDLKRGKEKFLK